jgi:hypothetical protein
MRLDTHNRTGACEIEHSEEGMAAFLRQGVAGRSEADRVHMARSFADAPPVLI